MPQVSRLRKISRQLDDDKRILPKKLYKTSHNRNVRKDACLWIAFYFETEEVLTAAARVKAMRGALAHNHSWTELRHCKFEESRTVKVLLSSIWEDVDRRLSQLKVAQQMVVEGPGDSPRARLSSEEHAFRCTTLPA